MPQDREKLIDLLARWEGLAAGGSVVTPEELCRDCPELLDDLAARFIANGWSLKWLHREIMLSSAYRQSSAPREDAEQVDSTNKFLWRMNPRRLDIEAYRDSMMHASGTLSDKLYGVSIDFDDMKNDRRTIYSRISRGRRFPSRRACG